MSTTDPADFTGIRREAPGWGYYLRGKRVGERTLFTQTKQALAELQEPPEPKPEPPAAETVAAEPIPTIEADLLPKDGTDYVLLITSGERSWPGSIVVEKEHVEALIHRGVKRPPLRPLSVTEAIMLLEKRGYKLELSDLANPIFNGYPVGKWYTLPAHSRLQDRKAARFTRHVPA